MTVKKILLSITLSFSAVLAGFSAGASSAGDAWVGWRWGPFMPYLSPSFITTGGCFVNHFQSHNDNLPVGYQDVEQNDTTALTAGLLLAGIGCRGVFGSGELKPTIRLSAGMPLPVYLRFRSNDSTGQAQLDSLRNRLYKKPTPTVLLGAGIGLEASVSRRVAVGGELNYARLYGGAWLKNNYSQNDDGSYWEREENRVAFTFSKVGAGIWVNFYF